MSVPDVGQSNVVLRCRNTANQAYNFAVPAPSHPATELVLDNGKLIFRAAVWLPEVPEANDVLGQSRLLAGEDGFLFEARVPGCSYTIAKHNLSSRTPSFDRGSASTPSRNRALPVARLQPGDSVNLTNHHFGFDLIRMPPERVTMGADPPVVRHVLSTDDDDDDGESIIVASKTAGAKQSSQKDQINHLVPPPANVGGDAEETGSADASDGDDVSDSATSNVAAKLSYITPATEYTTVGAIEESPYPARKASENITLASRGQQVPNDPSSPLLRKMRGSQSQSPSQDGVPGSQGAQPSNKLGGLSMSPMISSPKKLKLNDGSQRSDAFCPTTSDRDEHDTAAEAARRNQLSRKRNSLEMDKGVEPDHLKALPPPKKARRLPKAALHDKMEVLEPEPQYATTSTASPASQSLTNRTASIATEENIVVARFAVKTRKTRKTAPRSTKTKDPVSAQAVVPIIAPGDTSVSDVGTTALEGKVPKVLITTSKKKEDKQLVEWLGTQGVKIIDLVPSKRTHFVCVVPSHQLPKTSKTLRSLALGKCVVTDDCLTDSSEQGQLLDPPDYIHPSLGNETNLDRSVLFRGSTIFFTKKLVAEYGSEFTNVKALALEAGASLAENGSAAKGYTTSKVAKQTIFLGSTHEDKDVAELMVEHGFKVYHKDLLTESVLRGVLDLEDEQYRLKAPKKLAGKRKGRG
ncbi:hypothetical protein LTR62_002653 [Meristemomyces frigidus]|uniref:BRCT domain-containing protein n=1 Tax=Meristemomyces frigidus TaxID=1508187 RepID=A0AAN7TFF1_9PEZI|nr:hypothetical protein LTR62_002653 [Meristemomyces frigidus]